MDLYIALYDRYDPWFYQGSLVGRWRAVRKENERERERESE